MSVHTASARRGRAHKRAAVLAAARAVFGRSGYVRTSIDAIAEEAGVSTRTIYNHFASKDELFNAVLLHSAGKVAEEFIAQVHTQLAAISPRPPAGEPPNPDPVGSVPVGSGPDAQAVLEVVGRAMVAHRADNREHFALVRQISAEADHVPPSVLEGWQEAGPLRVHAEVMTRLAQLRDRGLLEVTDTRRAALHFIALVQIEAGQLPAGHSPGQDRTAMDRDGAARAGAYAFLNGYRPRDRLTPVPTADP